MVKIIWDAIFTPSFEAKLFLWWRSSHHWKWHQILVIWWHTHSTQWLTIICGLHYYIVQHVIWDTKSITCVYWLEWLYVQSFQFCPSVPQAKSLVSGGFLNFIMVNGCPMRLLYWLYLNDVASNKFGWNKIWGTPPPS